MWPARDIVTLKSVCENVTYEQGDGDIVSG